MAVEGRVVLLGRDLVEAAGPVDPLSGGSELPGSSMWIPRRPLDLETSG